MAAYHGEKYIGQQIDSILSQLGQDDEIIISDDAPGGETQKIIEACAVVDSRIHYVAGEGRGVVFNFENALKNAKGDFIFLCDQDDVWLETKVSKVMAAFGTGALLVLHDAAVTDENLKLVQPSFFYSHSSGTGFVRNFLRNSYMGCCMAFRRELLAFALPFPGNIPMHDQWLGLVAEKKGEVALLPEQLIFYRRHGGNVTGNKTSLKQKLLWRFSLFRSLIKL